MEDDMSTVTAEKVSTQKAAATAPRSSPRKAAFASWIGSAVEYYDFFIYGTAAALVFGKIFFPAFDPVTATIAAFATFGVGYVTRPLGAVLLGHVGDKYGRKRVLTFTLLLMGVSTFLVGLLPNYNSWGAAAPIILIALRMAQGLALGGEWDGLASLLALNAPKQRRGWYAMIPQLGAPLGLMVAAGLFA
ncbi:MAG: MFS transporter, partial [Sphingomonadaceae bacterium]